MSIKELISDSLSALRDTTRVRNSRSSTAFKALEKDVFSSKKAFVTDKQALKEDSSRIACDMRQAIEAYNQR